jgi:hypothetical protein
MPVHVRRSNPEITEFDFGSTSPVLVGSLITLGDLVVAAEWQGECWDFLFSEEVRAENTPNGVLCSLCEQQGQRRLFPTSEALWRDHLFLPLETWIRTKLAVADAVALYRTSNGGARWARLILHDTAVGSAAFLVPIRHVGRR